MGVRVRILATTAVAIVLGLGPAGFAWAQTAPGVGQTVPLQTTQPQNMTQPQLDRAISQMNADSQMRQMNADPQMRQMMSQPDAMGQMMTDPKMRQMMANPAMQRAVIVDQNMQNGQPPRPQTTKPAAARPTPTPPKSTKQP